MPIAQSLLPEFDREMTATRTMLERVPDDKSSWKPHEKSMPIGRLADHLATLPRYATMALQHTEMDMNPPDGTGERYQMPVFGSTAERLTAFDETVKQARDAIVSTSDDEMGVVWSLKNAGQTIVAFPRTAAIRTLMMSHLIHHRGQLSVYLRLLDVPLPSVYGPTADTPFNPSPKS